MLLARSHLDMSPSSQCWIHFGQHLHDVGKHISRTSHIVGKNASLGAPQAHSTTRWAAPQMDALPLGFLFLHRGCLVLRRAGFRCTDCTGARFCFTGFVIYSTNSAPQKLCSPLRGCDPIKLIRETNHIIIKLLFSKRNLLPVVLGEVSVESCESLVQKQAKEFGKAGFSLE